MLLVKKIYFDAIRSRRKTTTLRYWRCPRVRPGSMHTVRGLGRVRIDDVRAVDAQSLTAADAHADGFASLRELKAALAGMYPPDRRDGRKLYLVRFTYLSNLETGKAGNPTDVRQEHELLAAEVRKLRGVVKGMLGDAPRKAAGGIDLDALARRALGRDNVRPIAPGAPVPIINKVAAGYPRDFTDMDYPPSVADEYIRCPDVHDPQAFAARVVGDSMEPAYRQGDIVIFAPGTPAKDGDDCFVRFADHEGTTFKRFYQDDERTIRLQPLNGKYPAETHPRENITGLWPAIYRVQRLRAD